MYSPRLFHKVAIVTGSSTGIGRAIALALAAEKAHVVCADLNPRASLETGDDEASVPTHELIRHSADGTSRPEAMFQVADAEKVHTAAAKANTCEDLHLLAEGVQVRHPRR
ncbi:MAG: hypothetical protein Q9207_000430 [Kuettlingeria erythrocarpa]